ncbi:hypothetical protein C2S51_005637 [Perilla frutescens var. frutescens]|nr:hypothetical protein C2S51_005637 [Perilla frutescens var. frutescens]
MEQQHKNSTFGKEDVCIGIPISSQDFRYSITSSARALLPDPAANQYQILPSPSKQYSKIRRNRVNSVITKMVKIRESMDILAQGIREHVRLGPKLSETVKGKLRLGARILQVGGVKKVLEKKFDIKHGEILFTASQCYLSTTAGPIAGLLFVSSERVAFCSDRSIKLSSSPQAQSIDGNLLKLDYKVMIPLSKIKRAIESENVKKPREKYVEIVTEDNFDFWFMGFLNHQRTLRHLQKAIHQARTDFWPAEII